MSSAPGEHPSATPGERPAETKKVAAGICGILLGGFGIHKFILGMNTPGIIMLALTLAGTVLSPCLLFAPLGGATIMHIIGIAEGVIYLTKTDEEFHQIYEVGKKEWF